MKIVLKPSAIKPAVLATVVTIMLGSVALAETMRPSKFWSDYTGQPVYEDIVPHQFGDWVELPHGNRIVVDPVQEENLKRIYSETFARSFIHKPTGRVIMLSIAYGRDQSNDTQLHTPDQCYPSQGFKVEENRSDDIATPFGVIKATRLSTTLGSVRKEPLTFFIRVGDGIARGSKERNFERIKLALRGYRVDGMLFRVSELTRQDAPFPLQDQFIKDLLTAMPAKQRKYIIGAMGS